MKISGKTVDDQRVVSGVFLFVGTHGLPLEVVIERLSRRSLVVDWVDYVASARRDGHKPRTIRARILSAVADVHGPAYSRGFQEAFDNAVKVT